MNNESAQVQFVRTEALLGSAGFARLRDAFIVVAGMGAVGSYAAESLVRAGAHNLRVVDFDVISESNINRQLFALHSTLGGKKVDVARERLLDINPQCSVDNLDLFIREESLDQVFAGNPDIVIDAIDSLNPKVSLLHGAVVRGLTIISSMGAALRTDPTKIEVCDLSKSRNCPLARRVRKRLRRVGVSKGIDCVYSYEELPENYREYLMTEDITPCTGQGRKRNALGSLSTITGIFGLTLANLAIKKLAGK